MITAVRAFKVDRSVRSTAVAFAEISSITMNDRYNRLASINGQDVIANLIVKITQNANADN